MRTTIDDLKLIDFKCAAMHLDRFPAKFLQWLQTPESSDYLIIRRMDDDAPNVVINVDEYETIETRWPEVCSILKTLSDNGYAYLFISQDFYAD